jgi:hypothetical protein
MCVQVATHFTQVSKKLWILRVVLRNLTLVTARSSVNLKLYALQKATIVAFFVPEKIIK